jgi:hypothetical protein
VVDWALNPVCTEITPARVADLKPIIAEIHAAGVTKLSHIAAALNECGIPTSRGEAEWSAVQVDRVLKRMPS